MTWSGLNIFEGLRKKLLMAETFFIFYANAKRRDRHTYRQTDRQTDRQRDRQTNREIDR
jgi:hypothetical protein